MTPLERYRSDLDRGAFIPDAAQQRAVIHTQRVYEGLMAAQSREPGLFERLGLRFGERPRPVRGLYLWGGVGRGKTHIVNAFHESLPFANKLRIHFHSFMQRIHTELNALRERRDPLRLVAARLAEEACIISLDEFHVSDITDAMLLGRLLDVLHQRGVTLVSTSNIPPDDLYRDGLQRARFLPAIELIKQHNEVVQLDSELDYRLRALTRAQTYYCSLDEQSDAHLTACFDGLSPENVCEGGSLEVAGREIPTVRQADGIVWFEFSDICESPRSTIDYIEIARRFHTILIANVPKLDGGSNDRVARFVHLVDELYDRSINTILSAAAPPAELYTRGPLAAQFERTRSRLEEMQSREYLSRQHVP